MNEQTPTDKTREERLPDSAGAWRGFAKMLFVLCAYLIGYALRAVQYGSKTWILGLLTAGAISYACASHLIRARQLREAQEDSA